MASKYRERLLAIVVWVLVWQIAAMSLGHGGLFLATPGQTLSALARLLPTAAFWNRIAFSALRIVAGFVLAVVGGLVLGAAGSRWHLVRVFVDPVMQLIRAMPVASFVILALLWVSGSNLSVVVSFTHVLPVVYAGVLAGIADTDPQLLEMARVYRLPLTARLRYIWLPGIFPSFAKAALPPWECAGRAVSRRRSSACPIIRWAMHCTVPRSPFPLRMSLPGRWSSCCCRPFCRRWQPDCCGRSKAGSAGRCRDEHRCE